MGDTRRAPQPTRIAVRRAGDALHLACAEAAGAKHIATLDDVLRRNAQRPKIKPIMLRGTP